MSGADSDEAYWQARGQHPVACTQGGGCWIRGERWSFVRSTGELGPPDARERRELFWRRFTPLISWVDAADSDGNALFYACRDGAYDLERLPKKSRRDIARGLNGVAIRRVDFYELARLGYPAWADTRARNRANVPPPSQFVADCRLRARFSCQAAWGAFVGDTLAAWMTTHRVRDRVELGTVSIDWSSRHLCASSALVYEVTRAALVEDGAREVGFGLSSLPDSRAGSLHQFKIWLGFEALPVRRRFELHPLLGPLARPRLVDAAGAVLARAPQDRLVRKLRGALALMRTA